MWNRADNTLANCTEALCPHATPLRDGRLVNFAPYFAEGGEAYSIRASAETKTKEMLVEFFTWLTELPIDEIPLSGQYVIATTTPHTPASNGLKAPPSEGTLSRRQRLSCFHRLC